MKISASKVKDRLKELAEVQRFSVQKVEPYIGEIKDFGDAAILARHVLTGNPNDLSNRFERWGSWVHGIPLAHLLLRHELVLVDLYPIHEQEFPSKYGVTRDQFWMLAQNGYLIVNIVNFDSDEKNDFKEHRECASSIGPILLDPKVKIIILSQARRPIFKAISGEAGALDKNYEEASRRFRKAAEKFQTFALENPTGPSAKKAEYRGRPPHPEKILWNWSYWRTALPLLKDDSDPVLEAILNEDSRYDLYNPVVFSDFAQRLTYNHHTYTAPLTGAFGGTYNMDPLQAGVMAEIAEEKQTDFDPADAKEPFHNTIAPEFLKYLGNIAAGRIKPDGSNVTEDHSSFLFQAHKFRSQVMHDFEFIDFLDFLRFNRDTLRRQNSLMASLTANNGKKAGSDLSYEEVIGEIQKAKSRSESFMRKFLPRLIVGGGGAALGGSFVLGLPISLLVSVFGEKIPAIKKVSNLVTRFNNHHREIISFQEDWRFTK